MTSRPNVHYTERATQCDEKAERHTVCYRQIRHPVLKVNWLDEALYYELFSRWWLHSHSFTVNCLTDTHTHTHSMYDVK